MSVRPQSEAANAAAFADVLERRGAAQERLRGEALHELLVGAGDRLRDAAGLERHDADAVRAQLDGGLPAHRLNRVEGEQLADCGWSRNDFTTVARAGALPQDIAARAGDPTLDLLAEKIDCVAGLTTRDLAVTAARAEALYDRGVAAGNPLVAWSACGVRQISCVLGEDPETGIVWTDRLIATHLRLGNGGGGAFLEALANHAANAGDPGTAVPLYAASQIDARRVGMDWPVQLGSDTLLARLRAEMEPARFEALWAEGEGLTLEDVARARGLTAA